MPTTLAEAMKTIGKEGTISVASGLTINVRVLDFKNSYGKDRWLVEPVSGTGKIWVETVSNLTVVVDEL